MTKIGNVGPLLVRKETSSMVDQYGERGREGTIENKFTGEELVYLKR